MKEDKEEQKWLESIQKRLLKYISSPYWDNIKLSDVYMDIISQIMKAKSVKTLSPLINERITDQIFNRIKTEMQRARNQDRSDDRSK